MDKGFFSSLFDISFTSFVTTKIIKVVYVLSLVLIAISALVFVIAAFDDSTGLGVFMLFVGAPLAALLYTVYTRVILEFIIQVFRISELLRDQGELQRQAFTSAGWLGGGAPPAPASPAPPLGPEAPTTTAAAIAASCPNCGAPTTPGARFCRSCGHQLG